MTITEEDIKNVKLDPNLIFPVNKIICAECKGSVEFFWSRKLVGPPRNPVSEKKYLRAKYYSDDKDFCSPKCSLEYTTRHGRLFIIKGEV